MSTTDPDRLRRVVAGRLQSLAQAGVMELPRVKVKQRKTAEPRQEEAPEPLPPPMVVPVVTPSPASARPAVPKKDDMPMAATRGWTAPGGSALFDDAAAPPREISTAPGLEVLQQEVTCCTRCDELAATRTQTVFGVGNPQARLCFVGEAPGADEDRQGEPFVGRAGQLLNKIIEACKMRREDVYICNILKCRPPGNRNPDPVEAGNCRRFLERQLELVAPEFICCLGAVAAQNLLGTTLSIGKLRGKVHTFRGAKVVCTYHPAYLLRNPAAKKDTWEDMKFLMREMGVEV